MDYTTNSKPQQAAFALSSYARSPFALWGARLAIGAAIAVSSSGCVQMEGDIPEVVITHQHLVFDGVPSVDESQMPGSVDAQALQEEYDLSQIPEGALPPEFEGQVDPEVLPEEVPNLSVSVNPDGSMSATFDHPYGAFDTPDGLETELRPVRATLIPTVGVEDLSFLESFTLVVGSRAEGGPPSHTVFAYSSADAGGGTGELTVEAAERPNLLDYWDNEGAFYTLTVNGDLPEHEWAIDVKLEFRARVKIEL